MPQAEMADLKLHVRLLDEPCLWLWELRARDCRVVESSWETQWVGFASRQDAEVAGRRRVAELMRTRRLDARVPVTPPTVRRAS